MRSWTASRCAFRDSTLVKRTLQLKYFLTDAFREFAHRNCLHKP